jgi:hypothetical protein
MILIPAISKSVHLLLDLSAQGGGLSDEPIQVFNLPFQLVDIGDFKHVRIEISAVFPPFNSRKWPSSQRNPCKMTGLEVRP